MLKKTLLLMSMMLLFTTAVSYAAELKVGVVDVDLLLNSSTRVEALKVEVRKEFNVLQADLKSKEDELKKKIKAFDEQKDLFSDEVKRTKGEAIRKEQDELVKTLEDYQRTIKKKEKKIMQSVVAEVRDIVHDQGYSIVFEKKSGFIIYAAPEIQITESIIEMYDSRKKNEK